MITDELIAKIQEKADIVQIISSYINVIKKGNSYVAICPFHADHDPSLHISKSKQIYKCFVCGSGGNVFTFVSEYEHISFMDAVRKVAEMIGFTDPLLNKPTRVINEGTNKILDVLKASNEIYQYLLKSNDGVKAKKYLESRNIPLEKQEYFGLGFSSTNPELPIKLLRNKGFDIEEISNAGILARQNDSFIDRFNNRLIFPIYNEFNDVVGFSGRKIEDNDEAKYVNSPNTIVFNKSKVIYNYQNAKNEAKREQRVYVTEGFMDVFALYEAGIRCAVALMGTAFTQYHAKLLKKLNVEIVLCLDGDNAGQKAMIKAGEVLDKEGIDYKVVNYKECTLDPDEILQKYGKDILFKFLNRIIDKNDFIYNFLKKQYDTTTLNGRKMFAEALIPHISNTTNVLEKEMLIDKVCKETGIDKKVYQSLISNNIVDTHIDFNTLYVKGNQRRTIKNLELLQSEVAYFMLTNNEAIDVYKEQGAYFFDKIYDYLANYIIDLYETKGEFSTSELITSLSQSNSDYSKKVITLVTDLLETTRFNPEYNKEYMLEYLDRMKKQIIKKNRDNQFYNSIDGKTEKEKALICQKYFDEGKEQN